MCSVSCVWFFLFWYLTCFWIWYDHIYLIIFLMIKSIELIFEENWQQFLSGTVEALENVRKWKRTVTTMHGLVIKLPNQWFPTKKTKKESWYKKEMTFFFLLSLWPLFTINKVFWIEKSFLGYSIFIQEWCAWDKS